MKKLFSFLTLLLVSTANLAYALPTPTAGQNPVSFSSTGEYISTIQTAPKTFTALAARWHEKVPAGTSAELSVRFSNNTIWSEWYELKGDIDGPTDQDPEYPSSLLPTNPTSTFQYRVNLQSDDPKKSALVENITFEYLNTQEKVSVLGRTLWASTATSAPAAATSLTNSSLKIISRAEWGADESIRIYKGAEDKPPQVRSESDTEEKYPEELKIVKKIEKDADGNTLAWPLEYPEKISKIVIHHTASTKGLEDPKTAVRNIYYFHAVSRGWGDIGYNYIIDQQGNIYEGRYGGDGVVGGHASGNNIGSIGIAVLGNFEDNDVPEPVIKSLTALIKAKTDQYHIDPLGFSSFRGKTIPNIIGHRDVGSTRCPGQKLYDQIPALRLAVQTGFKAVIIDRGKNLAVNKKYDFQLANNVPLIEFLPGEQKQITLVLKNNGPGEWGPQTHLILSQGANTATFFKADKIVASTKTTQAAKLSNTVSFTMNLQAGYQGGFTTIEVVPLIDGITKVEKYINIPVQVKQPNFDYEITSITNPKPYLKIGEETKVKVTIKNNGNATWRRSGPNNFTLGADTPRDHANKLLTTPSNRLGTLDEAEVKPGQTGHVTISLKGPKTVDLYKEQFTPLIEGVAWFAKNKSELKIFAYKNEYESKLIARSNDKIFLPGETKKVWFRLENLGGVKWDKVNFDLKAKNTVKIQNLALEEPNVEPGSNGTISFNLTAPTKIGTYTIQVKPKQGTHALTSYSVNYVIRVQKTVPTSSVKPTTPTPTSSSSSSKNIRIDLSYRGNPVITGNGAFQLMDGTKVLESLTKDQQVTVSYDPNSAKYTAKTPTASYSLANPPRLTPTSGTILRIENFDRKASWDASIHYNEFRGVLEPHWYNNELHVFNELPIEDYLKGTGEINETEPTEKLRAIVIVSRSYAVFYTTQAEKFPGAPFHLTDDPQTSQKYIGYSAEKRAPNTVKAVNDTAGLVVTYQGTVIKTPYFSSDDGHTRSAQEVWGWTNTPYLISVPDPYCAGKTLNGHGVGLSGCGSLGMAKAGKTYQEIIKYYYQGVEIQKK